MAFYRRDGSTIRHHVFTARDSDGIQRGNGAELVTYRMLPAGDVGSCAPCLFNNTPGLSEASYRFPSCFAVI